MPVWSLECRWAGRTFFPTLAENPSVSSQASLWSPRTASRSASLSFLDDIGVARLVSQGHMPQSGLGILRYNDRVIVAGAWSGVEYGPLGSPVRLTIGESTQDDTATLPAVGAILRKITEQELAEGIDERGLYATGESFDFLTLGPVTAKATLGLWQAVSRVAEGRTYPMVIGAPGSTTHPGSPALFVDTLATDKEWVIAGHEVDATTVTIWGPGPEGELTSDGATGVAVHHKEDLDGRLIAYVTSADMTSTQNSEGAGGELILGTGLQFDPSADYFVSWTGGEALPSGAGDALLMLLRLSSLRVDFGAWHSLRDRLNAYTLAGYVDDEVSPSALALNTIAKDLPVSAEYGEHGLRPVLWPWLDDIEALTASAHIVCGTRDPDTGEFGAGFLSYLAGGVGFTGDAPLGVYRIEHGYDPESTAYTLTATVSPEDTAYGAAAISHLGHQGRVETSQTRWIQDTSTALSLAAVRMRAHSLPRRVVRVLCDVEQYGPGAADELYCGRPVLLTCPSLHIDAEPAFVSRLGWRGPVLDVTLELRDDPLWRNIEGPAPVVSTTVYLMAVGDNGSSQSYAMTSTDATSYTSVSGLPAEGVLNAAAHDGDLERYLAVGQAGASVLVSQDGATVTDVTVGGTSNREGVSYRPASESGGALYVVVGSAGRLDYSADGTTYTQVTGFGSTGLYLSYFHTATGFFVGGNGGNVWYSSTGTSGYTSVSPSGTQRVTDMAWSGTHLVMCRRSGKVAYATPANAAAGTWTEPTTGVSDHLHSIASDAAGVVIAVGDAGRVLRSTDDGASWSTVTSGVATALRGVAYAGSDIGFVAVGDSSVVLTSADGLSWSSQSSPATDDLEWVATSAGYP